MKRTRYLRKRINGWKVEFHLNIKWNPVLMFPLERRPSKSWRTSWKRSIRTRTLWRRTTSSWLSWNTSWGRLKSFLKRFVNCGPPTLWISNYSQIREISKLMNVHPALSPARRRRCKRRDAEVADSSWSCCHCCWNRRTARVNFNNISNSYDMKYVMIQLTLTRSFCKYSKLNNTTIFQDSNWTLNTKKALNIYIFFK